MLGYLAQRDLQIRFDLPIRFQAVCYCR
jgi:hypothetical protein